MKYDYLSVKRTFQCNGITFSVYIIKKNIETDRLFTKKKNQGKKFFSAPIIDIY